MSIKFIIPFFLLAAAVMPVRADSFPMQLPPCAVGVVGIPDYKGYKTVVQPVKEVPRVGVTCAGIWNKAKGWMNEEGEICKFDPVDVRSILRICGEGPCLVVGSVVDCPVNCVKMTHITSISRAKLDDVGGVDLLNAPGLSKPGSCLGEMQKGNMMLIAGDGCEFSSEDVAAIRRVCGSGPCAVTGEIMQPVDPDNLIQLKRISSIRRATVKEIGPIGAD